MTSYEKCDPRLLRLAAGDNVLIATSTIHAGESFFVDGRLASSPADIPTGFKVAAEDFAVGDVAVRLATPIGRSTRPIGFGEVVHTHNLASQYLSTHARGEA